MLKGEKRQDFRMRFGEGKAVAGWCSVWVILQEICVPAIVQETLFSFSHS